MVNQSLGKESESPRKAELWGNAWEFCCCVCERKTKHNENPTIKGLSLPDSSWALMCRSGQWVSHGTKKNLTASQWWGKEKNGSRRGERTKARSDSVGEKAEGHWERDSGKKRSEFWVARKWSLGAKDKGRRWLCATNASPSLCFVDMTWKI